MLTPPFEFFEHVCIDLSEVDSVIITPEDFPESLTTRLKHHYKQPVTARAVSEVVGELETHFNNRDSALPFQYDSNLGQFVCKDRDFVQFVSESSLIRGNPKKSKDFEVSITRRLTEKLTGIIHRVGWPRDQKNRKVDFIKHLEGLGFRSDVLYGNDKDGGLDILWLPPLGAIPIRPIVSLQCKNAHFRKDDADASTGRGQQTLRRHSVRSADSTFMCCVVFNDYIDESYIQKNRDSNFVPLGLSDLGTLVNSMVSEVL